jgi:hypothetical protein
MPPEVLFADERLAQDVIAHVEAQRKRQRRRGIGAGIGGEIR